MKTINLTQNQVATVDDADFDHLAIINWCTVNCPYQSNGKNKYYVKNKKHGYMHRYLMNNPAGMIVDHINGNGLDNRRENLEIISRAENCRRSNINRTKYLEHEQHLKDKESEVPF